MLPRTSRPSRPAYDAMMVATSITGVDQLAGREQQIRDNFFSAANDPENYEILVGRGNTVEAIKERVELARKLLSDCGTLR